MKWRCLFLVDIRYRARSATSERTRQGGKSDEPVGFLQGERALHPVLPAGDMSPRVLRAGPH